jgi:hypothetical protein
MKRILPLMMIVSLVLSGCAVTEKLSINPAGDGRSDLALSAEPFFIDVLNDFEEFSDTKNPESVMDKAVSDIQKNLQRGTGTSQVSFTKTGERSYEGVFSFSSISSLLSDLGADPDQSLLTVKDNTMTFYLDLENYPQLTKVIPFLADKNFEPFGPTYNQGISAEDYLEMISFMLGDEGPDAITSSSIVLDLQTPGDITAVSGGTKTGPRSFRFQFPLLDFLLLQKPIQCSVSWKN